MSTDVTLTPGGPGVVPEGASAPAPLPEATSAPAPLPHGAGPEPFVEHPRRDVLGGILAGGWRGIEAVFATFGLFALSGALFPLLLQQPGGSGAEGDPTLRSLFFAIYAVMLFYAIFRWKSFLGAIVRDPLTILLVVAAGASVVWSLSPDVTLRRAIALGLTTCFGWYLVARYPLRSILRLLASAIGVALVLSVVFALWVPELGIGTGSVAGSWQGVFVHKNALGKMAALGALLFILLMRSEGASPWLPAAGLLLALGLLVLSESQTGVIVFLTLLALLPVFGVLRWRIDRGAPFIAGAVFLAGSAAVLISTNLELALSAIGREATLTGRTALWAAVFEIGSEKPMLGVGYSAFWDGQQAWTVRDLAGWGAEAAHNGFLDVWLELGFVGVALLLSALLLAARRGVRLLRSDPAAEAALPLLLLAFIVLSNLSEGGILRQNNLVWVLFVVASVAATRTFAERGRYAGDRA